MKNLIDLVEEFIGDNEVKLKIKNNGDMVNTDDIKVTLEAKVGMKLILGGKNTVTSGDEYSLIQNLGPTFSPIQH